jgi:dephospho-CoA kinase
VRPVLIIGLTGGIGSGKTTVASMLADRGAVVVDCDALGREVIAPGGRAEAAVLVEFGDAIGGSDGHIDRALLAKAVFGQPEALARLTAISHPAINAEIAARLDRLRADAIVVLDMAILVESNLGRLADGRSYSHVLVVEVAGDLRVQRAVARGMNEADVRARIASQATDEQRRAVADAVIANDGDLSALSSRVGEVWHLIEAWAQEAK